MAEATVPLNERARAALRRLEWRLRQRVDNPLVGDHRSLFRGRGMEFDQVVRYTFGDDVRDIDWNVTARLGEPYRKVFVEEREASVCVVVNDTPALQFGSGQHSKRDRLFELAGLILLLASLNRDRVVLVHRWPGGQNRLPATRHRRRILAAIAQLFARPAPDPSADLTFDTSPLAVSDVPRGSLLIWLGEVPEGMPGSDWVAIRRRQQVIGIRVEDGWERTPPDAAFTAFDSVSRAIVTLSPGEASTAAHRRWADARAARWQAWWPEQGQRLVVAVEADPLAALVSFLRTRRG
ncbi:DUF58 domain-containing protein [Sandarakinorhabdus sp.]|uniref:DUF58 domain-containing protein n=1 Tax=Sandarakinorhabdus sp. TaxID=1916663 RepID=UPI003F718296